VNPEIANHELINQDEHTVRERYTQDVVNGYDETGRTTRGSTSLTSLIPALWRERRFIAKTTLAGLLLAAVVSLLIPSEYESTIRIMPPEKQGFGGLASMLAAATEDKAGSVVGGLVSNAVGLKSSGALFMGVLRSNSVEDTLIDQFDLRKVYRVRYMKDARDRLSQNTDINEDRKSGIIAITVTDRSPQRAQQVATAYISTLNRLTAQLDTSAAHQERVFTEERLKSIKQDLDAASQDLSEFSSKNLTLDVKEQGKAMVEGAAALQGQLIAAQSQLSGLEQIYAPNNVRVRALQARIASLRRTLSELQGNQALPANEAESGDFGISIAQLPSLGVTYYDLYRRVKIEEAVFEILTKQNELAKIEEAKELPTIKILDEANVPETRTSPKRRPITLFGGIVALIMAIGYIMLTARLNTISPSHPVNLFGLELRHGLEEDWAALRSRIPKSILHFASSVRARIARNHTPAGSA
jgi:capsule polysaccharide export protein KpsE/RkpR